MKIGSRAWARQQRRCRSHPLYPRGPYGAEQAILQAAGVALRPAGAGDAEAALAACEEARLGPTSHVMRTHRTAPPDMVTKTVWRRTGDKPFERIEDIIPREELMAQTDRYKRVAGYSKAAIQA